MLRLLSLLCVLTASSIGIYGVYKQADVSILCGTFLTAAFTGKIAQKHLERSNGQ